MFKEIVRATVPKNLRWEVKKSFWRGLKKTMEGFGYTIARRSDYYSPLTSVPDLKAKVKRWNKPSAMKGVVYDIQKMESKLGELLAKYLQEFLKLPPFAKLITDGYGPGFTHVDGLTLYMMIRELKPKRYIEVGSGLSTYYCSLAAAENAKEGHPVQITCIEPYPYEKLKSIQGIQLVVKEVQDVDVSLFQQLKENDVFFIDSSHMLKVDSDVPFLFLEVLPTINAGVSIHVHDVPFPYNIPYPADAWIIDQIWPMLWNEAMVLQAFLCCNSNFSIEMSTPFIRHFDEAFLMEKIPGYETIDQNAMTFSSLWMRRNS